MLLLKCIVLRLYIYSVIFTISYENIKFIVMNLCLEKRNASYIHVLCYINS